LINLGFSGNACGDIEIAEYIATLEMSCFVMQNQNNSPTVAEYEKTHWPFFATIRKAHPELPIIISSGTNDIDRLPRCRLYPAINLKTYQKALVQGDRNIYYYDGHAVFSTPDRDGCTVDGIHPNDLGSYRIFESLKKVLRNIYRK
jgi:lysophospholipase L1-like esterase